MRFSPLAIALAFAAGSALFAQAEFSPQMVWQGQVEGSVFLYVRGKHVEVEPKNGGSVEKPHVRIKDPLPQTNQEVRLNVAEGRGYVHIIDQPRAGNRFTLAIAIEDRQSGPSFYSLVLRWTPGDAFDEPGNRGLDHLKWTGRVDDEVIVSCRAKECSSAPVQGAAVMHEKVSFSGALPARDAEVRLEAIDGRGQVKLLEQPSAANDYTARISIRDPQTGAGDYSFALVWKRTALASQTGVLAPHSGLVWSGRVDETVRVVVRGGATYSQVVSGQPVAGEHTAFDRPLPSTPGLKPVLKKRSGRGAVEIVEYPSSNNGFQFVFEIRDPDAGSDLYEVEVDW